jgi:hypothetical protein
VCIKDSASFPGFKDYTGQTAPDGVAILPLPNATAESKSRLEIKENWWNQIIDFARNHPGMKAVCSFEFIKPEEFTSRDFTMFGAPGPQFEYVDNHHLLYFHVFFFGLLMGRNLGLGSEKVML